MYQCFARNCYFIVIKHPTGLCQTKGFSVFFWIILSHEVSRHFPTHQHTRTSRTFYIFTVHQPEKKPLHWWRIQCPVEGGTKSWIISSRLRPYSNFPKHLQKSRIVPCEPNPGRCPTCIGSQIYIYNKINR